MSKQEFETTDVVEILDDNELYFVTGVIHDDERLFVTGESNVEIEFPFSKVVNQWKHVKD